MALTPESRLKLLNALVDAFPTPEELDLLAFLYLPTSTQAISGSRIPDYMAKGLIEWAERNNQMLVLLDGAVARVNTNPMLTAVVNALRPQLQAAVPVYVAADPYETCLPRERTPFVNRSNLRSTLRSMVAPNDTAILAVHGDAQTGKSHTSFLISYLATQVQSAGGGVLYRIVDIHLGKQPPGFDAGELARQFALQLGLSTDTIPKRSETEQESRWSTWISSWIIGQIPAATERHKCDQIWLMVDGFQQATATPSAIDVLRRLAADALKRDDLRVILLDFADALPDIERSVQRDQVRRATKADVENYLEKIVTGTGRPMQPGDIQALADAIWQEALPENDGFMSRLSDAICSRLPTLLKRTP